MYGALDKVAETLDQRGEKYGDYTEMARQAQRLKRVFQDSNNWEQLPDYARESLDMITTKLARIFTGRWEEFDSWHDIEGYAKLVSDRLRPNQQEPAHPATQTSTGAGLPFYRLLDNYFYALSQAIFLGDGSNRQTKIDEARLAIVAEYERVLMGTAVP